MHAGKGWGPEGDDREDKGNVTRTDTSLGVHSLMLHWRWIESDASVFYLSMDFDMRRSFFRLGHREQNVINIISTIPTTF